MKKSHFPKFYLSTALLGTLYLSISKGDAYDRSVLPIPTPFIPREQNDAHLQNERALNPQFLGTMAGTPGYVRSYKHDDELTSGRVYEIFGDNSLRVNISQKGHATLGEGYKGIGEDYGSPRNLVRDKSFTMPGGGFFLTIKKLPSNEEMLNCFAYALGTYGEQLEKVSELPLTKIQTSVSNRIDHVLQYFDCVAGQPQDGDLAIYQTTKDTITPGGKKLPANINTHAGIYRNSLSNWNSPAGGTIESKWGHLANPYVFQHDMFFVPDFYGDIVKFYRLKNPIG